MDVTGLRGYGIAFSDLEATWPAPVRAKMRAGARSVLARRLGIWGGLRLAWAFWAEKARMSRVDLSAIRARGMRNEAFLAQQIEFVALYSALVKTLGADGALATMKAVMDETARDAMLLCLPEPEQLAGAPDPLAALRAWSEPLPAASRAAGCHEVQIVDEPDGFRTEMRWCVWLELARTLGVPDACLPACYSDDLVFPAYFAAVGIRYERPGTLAGGASCCDFRFSRLS